MFPIKFTIAASTAVIAGTGVYTYWTKDSIKFSYDVPKDFIESKTMKIINPKNHISKTDSFSTIITTNKRNDELLANFTKGFFGGPSMLVERSLMKYFFKDNYQCVGFTSHHPDISVEDKVEEVIPGIALKLPINNEYSTTIWNINDIPTKQVVSINTIFYGSFQAINYESNDQYSYLDIVFGTDLSPFAGSHRFEIVRLDDNQVKVNLHHLRCNPIENTDTPIETLANFHYVYAKLLFKDSIRLMNNN